MNISKKTYNPTQSRNVSLIKNLRSSLTKEVGLYNDANTYNQYSYYYRQKLQNRAEPIK